MDSHRLHPICISMPSSPSRVHFSDLQSIANAKAGEKSENMIVTVSDIKAISNEEQHEHQKSTSWSISSYKTSKSGTKGNNFDCLGESQRNPISDCLKEKIFDSFKDLSRKFEKWIFRLCERKQSLPLVPDIDHSKDARICSLSGRYYCDALNVLESNSLKDTEVLLFPKDDLWPFLLRFPISSFGICLGIGSQAILWKELATSPSITFIHVSPIINIVLWWISAVVFVSFSFIYSMKFILYFEVVRREYHHPIRVNFFFAPWVAVMFLALGVPPLFVRNLPTLFWYVIMAPVFSLELKLYGQWMSRGQRRLSKVANPSNHLSIVGNFVGALLGASMGLREGPIFFFAIGMAHYIVLFVTLYQRLPTNETLPKELHPIFFLFVAAPSVASMAWAKIQGEFDFGARVAYFVALFLYASLAVRVNFFRGFRFSLAWWAYTFPITGASVATITYFNEVRNPLTQLLSIGLSSISTLMVIGLLIFTFFHAFVLQNLFPNDIAVAVSNRKSKRKKKLWYLRSAIDVKSYTSQRRSHQMIGQPRYYS